MKTQRNRHSIRLRGYDYAQAGAYFVTICAWQRECLFEDRRFADAIRGAWEWLPSKFYRVRLDEFVIMPNHIHFVIWLLDENYDGRGGQLPAPTRTHNNIRISLPDAVGAFKTIAAKQINLIRGTPGNPVWQRNYYEHIIRNERALDAIREYIQNNPANWEFDLENPKQFVNTKHNAKYYQELSETNFSGG